MKEGCSSPARSVSGEREGKSLLVRGQQGGGLGSLGEGTQFVASYLGLPMSGTAASGGAVLHVGLLFGVVPMAEPVLASLAAASHHLRPARHVRGALCHFS